MKAFYVVRGTNEDLEDKVKFIEKEDEAIRYATILATEGPVLDGTLYRLSAIYKVDLDKQTVTTVELSLIDGKFVLQA